MKRSYTVKEIDELRIAVEREWFKNYHGPIYGEPWPEKTKCIEERLRTYMLAGITADDIFSENKQQEEAK